MSFAFHHMTLHRKKVSCSKRVTSQLHWASRKVKAKWRQPISGQRGRAPAPPPPLEQAQNLGWGGCKACLAGEPSYPHSHPDQGHRPACKGSGPWSSVLCQPPEALLLPWCSPTTRPTYFWPTWPKGPQRGRWAWFFLTKLHFFACSWIPHYLNKGGDIRGKETKSSVQFSCSVVSNSLRPHGLQHTRLPCPSPTPGVCTNSCPSSRWCHSTISSSVVPFSSRLQSFPASESFQMSLFFAPGGQSIGVSASTTVLPMNIQDWFPLGWTCLISLQFKGLSRVFSNTTVQKHQFFGDQLSL